MSAGRTISTSRREVVCFAVSVAVHLVVLGWGVFTFAIKPRTADSKEAMPIDIVSVSEFSQMTSGARNAPKLDTVRPLADKVGERKPVEDPTAKLAPKEVKAATDQQPPPPPPMPRPAAAEKKQSEPKRDLIADAIKKDQVKKPEPKKAEAKAPPKKQQQEQPKFDPRNVEALLNKRTPERVAAIGDVANGNVALGTPTGNARQLSLSELDALRARLAQLWSPPAGASKPDELVVVIRMLLKPDGTLAAPPGVVAHGNTPMAIAARDSAVRAVLRGQPFDMLRPEHYDLWKDIEITFDPRDMIRG
jgi:outer membrane biosynthesis protein TonB